MENEEKPSTNTTNTAVMREKFVELLLSMHSLLLIYQLPGLVVVASVLVGMSLLLGPCMWFALCFYVVWYLFDSGSEERGGRQWLWFRMSWLKACSAHFPIRLVKTCDLDPERNYIIGSHPHGACATGAFGAFGFAVAGFGRLFPGIETRFHVNGLTFRVPIFREFCLAGGCLSVSRRSLEFMLRKSLKGLACAIVIGGTRETAEEFTSHIALILKRRKGFVKIAIECGADLVPTFTFGENQLYDRFFNFNEFVRSTDSTFLRAVQEWFFSQWINPFIFAYGRAVFFGQWGLAPFRVPLTMVVGEPIKITQMDHPPEDEINRLHEQYVEALKHLYDTYNPIYGDINIPLVIR